MRRPTPRQKKAIGPFHGVELLALHKNEQTGRATVLRKLAAGTTISANVPSQVNKTAHVLSGKWEKSGVVYSSDTSFFAPRGELHGPHVVKREVISLTIFDGPL